MIFKTVEDQELFRLLEGRGKRSLADIQEDYYSRKTSFWKSAQTLLHAIRTQHAWRKYRAKYELGLRRFFHSYKGLSARRYLQRSLTQELRLHEGAIKYPSIGFAKQELLLYLSKLINDLLEGTLRYRSNDQELVEAWEIHNEYVSALSELMQLLIQEHGELSEHSRDLLLLFLEGVQHESNPENTDAFGGSRSDIKDTSVGSGD